MLAVKSIILWACFEKSKNPIVPMTAVFLIIVILSFCKFDFSGEKVTAIQGDLTFLGVTQPITLTAKNYNCFLSPMLKKEVCGGDFETVLDRSQFGLNYGINFGFPKEVKIVIQVEAVKKDNVEVNK